MTMTRPPLTAVPLGMPGFPARRPAPGTPASDGAAKGPLLRLGLDIGSTTVKLVVLPESAPGAPVPEPVYCEYRRHHADVRGEVVRLLAEAAQRVPRARVVGAVTGSAGLSLAQVMALPFVQEVIAETRTVQAKNPETDVIIELGGEDAKITYLHPTPEQRMNGTCAGGTGAFIDQMAQLLHTDAPGLNELASRYQTLYPIASRCGVFAKSDLQPLINQGAAGEDLAASVLQAVVTQTIAGLACGRPIRGRVMFLGGPLHFLPELRAAFERSLAEQVDAFICPPDAQLYVAVGAALMSGGEPTTLAELAQRLRTGDTSAMRTSRMRPLFTDDDELEAFRARHARIFMGDSGALTLGVLIAAAGILVTGQIDPANASVGYQLPAIMPLIVPAAVILLPLIDLVWAVVRRVSRGQSPFHADAGHLHHRLLRLGHSHTGAVLVLYMWATMASFTCVALVRYPATTVGPAAIALSLVGVIVTARQFRPRRFRRNGNGRVDATTIAKAHV